MDRGGTLISSTYERLRTDVLSGHWVPGQKLGIESLRDFYGTGATPVREALNRLAAEGWVQHLEQRGFVVSAVSESALRELTDTRIWVETLALSKGIARKTSAWEEALVVALHRLAKIPRSLSADRFDENPLWEQPHRIFHMTLVENCGSRWLTTFCGQLYDQAYRYRQLAIKTSYKRRNVLQEHRSIVDAVLAGDTPTACSALTAHYSKTAQIIYDSESRIDSD